MDDLINKFSTITATTINTLQLRLAEMQVACDTKDKQIAELKTQVNNLRKERLDESRRYHVTHKQDGNKDK